MGLGLTPMEFLELVGASLLAVATLAGLFGLLYRRGLLPNLREDLRPHIDEVADEARHARRAAEEAASAATEAVRQMKTNGHRDPQAPTFKDAINDIKHDTEALRREQILQSRNSAEVRDLQDKKLDEHLLWSQNEISMLWAAVVRDGIAPARPTRKKPRPKPKDEP